MKVLVLEHDAVARRWLEAGIRARGHAVTVCADEASAADAYRARGHRMVIIDWAVPRARQLCRLVRSGPDGSNAVILASGLSDRLAELEDALRAGADDYLPTPADDGVLHARLAVAEARLRQAAGSRRLDETAAPASSGERL